MTKVRLDATPDTTNNHVLVITTTPNLGTEFMLNNGTVWTEITDTKRTEIAKHRQHGGICTQMHRTNFKGERNLRCDGIQICVIPPKWDLP